VRRNTDTDTDHNGNSHRDTDDDRDAHVNTDDDRHADGYTDGDTGLDTVQLCQLYRGRIADGDDRDRPDGRYVWYERGHVLDG
jgi:hypothetical protein